MSNCETYYDGCQTCSVENWKISVCDIVFCSTYNTQDARCIKYKSKNSFLQNLKNKFTKTYRNIATSIQNFIEMLYSADYEKKKITLNIDWTFLSFSLHIPKSRKNKYSEHTILDKNSSTFMFKYSPSKLDPSMIFNITVIKSADRENLVKQWLPNANKIIESDWYVFYYSRALDMPYIWKYAEEYWAMVESIQDIIDTFKLIQ